ncbi:MAG: RNA 2',3'-cyclic phosphodiesterase [Conexivisphaerales archaeon]
MRLFVALQLKDENVRRMMAEYEKEIQRTGADVKLVNPELLHITLKFIGEVSDSMAETIAASLKKVEAKAFTIEFDRVGAFPSLGRINVVWAGSSGEVAELETLGRRVNEVTKGIGEEQRSFVPHITLARVKSGRNAEALRRLLASTKMNFGRATFDEFQLKKSVLTPSGPIYSDVEVYRLVV